MIYTSRNSFRLLNLFYLCIRILSTQVEILLGYLTLDIVYRTFESTQVEILLDYLTNPDEMINQISTQVEILLGYLTIYMPSLKYIYTSRNSFRLLNLHHQE